VLPVNPFFTSGSLDGNVKGSIKATSGANGVGVDFEVSFSNLPTEGGPFSTTFSLLRTKCIYPLTYTQPITSMSTQLMLQATAPTPWPSKHFESLFPVWVDFSSHMFLHVVISLS
jgi:hypothetical protein